MGIQSWNDLGGFVWPIWDAERNLRKEETLLEGHFHCWNSKNSVPVFILLNWIPPLAAVLVLTSWVAELYEIFISYYTALKLCLEYDIAS